MPMKISKSLYRGLHFPAEISVQCQMLRCMQWNVKVALAFECDDMRRTTFGLAIMHSGKRLLAADKRLHWRIHALRTASQA